jgi:hypothetical protein
MTDMVLLTLGLTDGFDLLEGDGVLASSESGVPSLFLLGFLGVPVWRFGVVCSFMGAPER